jgi:hypothetical protein
MPLRCCTYTFLRTLINFGSRLKLQQRLVSLNKLSLWAALSNAQIDWSFALRYFSYAAIVSVCLMVPGAIWAGALSPISTAILNVNGIIEVPAYTADSVSI